MKFILLLLLMCWVKCDDVSNNYYVIEMPDDVPRDFKKPFRVYWNVPTMQCKSKKILFDKLYEKYGIIQNEGDSFRGEKITIMYEPGMFPAIFKNETSGKYRFRNGGVPQEGNLDEHLEVFKKDMMEIVPDPNFNGIGIIDFESWRPIFRQNFGTLVPYKDVSYEIEKKLHWWWPKSWIHTEASQRFESAARVFMQTTLSIAKQMRPKALWGYYGFPHCFNMAGQNMMENCSPNVITENDVTYWMWSESTALYPSVYSSRNLSTNQLGALVRGRVREANRVRRYDTPVLPYYWFRYREGGYMTEEDLNAVLQSFYKSNASGFIIWGSSNDVNTVAKCKNLYNYVETTLGPTIAKYIKKINIANDVILETPLSFENKTVITTTEVAITNRTIIETTESSTNDFVRKGLIDPEFDWVPPVNYSEDISHNVEKELMRKGYNKTEDRVTEIKNLDDSAVIDMIFDALMKADSDESEINKQTTRNIQNETSFSDTVNNNEVTKAPKLFNKEILSSMITRDPLGFIEKLAEDEIHDQIFDEIPQIEQEINEMNEPYLVNTDRNWITFEENQDVSNFTPAVDILSNETAYNLKETITSKDDILKEVNVDKNEDDSIKFKPKNENFVMGIFDALFYAKYKIYDENKIKYKKNEQNKIKNHSMESNINHKEFSDISDKDNLNTSVIEAENKNITLIDDFFRTNYESTTENESQVTSQGTEITEIDFFDTMEEKLSLKTTTIEEIIPKKDIRPYNKIDEFLTTIANTDLVYESSTQIVQSTEFNNTDDNFIILAVNLSASVTEDSNSVIENIENKFALDETDTSTKIDGLVLENDRNEFIVDREVQESSNNQNYDTLTMTETPIDQVVTYIFKK